MMETSPEKKTSHWGEIVETPVQINQCHRTSFSPGKITKKILPMLSSSSSLHKMIELKKPPVVAKDFDEMHIAQDQYLMHNVKLVHKFLNTNMHHKDPAFVIADFTSVADPDRSRTLQTTTQLPVALESSADARELLKKAVATLMMHEGIMNCKESVLASMLCLIESFLREVGVQLTVTESAAGADATALLVEMEMVLQNSGINGGVGEVLKHYKDHVLRRRIFLEACSSHQRHVQEKKQ